MGTIHKLSENISVVLHDEYGEGCYLYAEKKSPRATGTGAMGL